MSYRARWKAQQSRAPSNGRGWMVGNNAGHGIGIRAVLNNVISTRTTPFNYSSGELKDDRNLVVCQNTLSGVGKKKSQFNVDADGITTCRYYIGEGNSGELLSFDVLPAPNPFGMEYVGVATLNWEQSFGWVPAGTVSPPSVGSYFINYILFDSNSTINICCSSTGTCNSDGPFNPASNYSITITSDGTTATIETSNPPFSFFSSSAAGIAMTDVVGGETSPHAANVIAANHIIQNIYANKQHFTITFTEIQ